MLKAICAFVVLLTSILAAIPQEARKTPEPEYIGVFFSLDPATGALVPLERQRPEVKTKVKALGLRGESLLEIQGEHSPVRFKANQPLHFVVRLASQAEDPNAYLEFYSLESKGGKRRLVVAKATITSGQTVANKKAIQFDVAKYGESSFKVSATQPLPPGEYVLSGKEIYDGFCFGVDAPDQP